MKNKQIVFTGNHLEYVLPKLAIITFDIDHNIMTTSPDSGEHEGIDIIEWN